MESRLQVTLNKREEKENETPADMHLGCLSTGITVGCPQHRPGKEFSKRGCEPYGLGLHSGSMERS